MARFKRPNAKKDTIHAEWWDEGEEIVLKPSMNFSVTQEVSKVSMNTPDNLTVEQLQAATPMQMLKWTDQTKMNLVLLQNQIKSWTFRIDPTEEQEAAGELGDLVPLTPQAISELEGPDVQFIVEEINKRSGGKRKEAEEEKPGFRSDVSTSTTSEGEEGVSAGENSIEGS